VARYETRQVPLLEALDADAGISFGDAADATSPLLEGLPFDSAAPSTTTLGARERLLWRWIDELRRADGRELRLSREQLDEIDLHDPRPLADAIQAQAVLLAADEAALDRGDYRVWMVGAYGPPGVKLLARFCHGEPGLAAHLRAHIATEEALAPDVIFAEIVHLPGTRGANLLLRPVLREHEIVFLGQSGAPLDRQIPVSDLLVSVDNDRVVLRSARHKKEIRPRLTSAHNYGSHVHPIYRFLCALQDQTTSGAAAWSWRGLDAAPFLPRVTHDRFILAPARWRIEGDAQQRLAARDEDERMAAVRALRRERDLPRWVAIEDVDPIVVDLDNRLCVAMLAEWAKKPRPLVVVEVLAREESLCVRGPEGGHVHEVLVPFVQRRKPEPPSNWQASAPITRTFAPGSEWLYIKLYTGRATSDRVLRELVAPLVREALADSLVDGWFFLRYDDPDPHVRVRFHGAADRLTSRLLPRLHQRLAPLLADGLVGKLQLDTYEREVERYGGAAAMAIAERVFQHDSDAVLEIIGLLEGDDDEDARWKLTLVGLHRLLDDLGLELGARLALVSSIRDHYAREHEAGVALQRRVGERHREVRAELEELLCGPGDNHPFAPGLDALRRRSIALGEPLAELRTLATRDALTRPLEEIAASFLHMHAIRMLRTAPRRHELVLYDFLLRHYASASHRG
jgi:thiopeptide-type bacteriocin biosynthesis protein